MNSSERRSYRSELRAQQAEQTRLRVAEVAARLFIADGYATTSIAAVARAAGVSAQTVYNAFGTKGALLKAAYDVALVGDTAPVPLAERADVRALYADPDPRALVRGYARLGGTLLERIGGLMLQVVAGAAAGDPDLRAHQEVTDRERLTGTTMVANRLRDLDALAPGLAVAGAADRIWTLNSVQVWALLTAQRGWSAGAYAEWIGEAMGAAVLRDP